MDVVSLIIPIVVALITGLFSYMGVARTVKASNDKTVSDLKADQEKFLLTTEMQINGIKEDIKRLEVKQDKHNSVIERTFKLEQKVEDLEKRMK